MELGAECKRCHRPEVVSGARDADEQAHERPAVQPGIARDVTAAIWSPVTPAASVVMYTRSRPPSCLQQTFASINKAWATVPSESRRCGQKRAAELKPAFAGPLERGRPARACELRVEISSISWVCWALDIVAKPHPAHTERVAYPSSQPVLLARVMPGSLCISTEVWHSVTFTWAAMTSATSSRGLANAKAETSGQVYFHQCTVRHI